MVFHRGFIVLSYHLCGQRTRDHGLDVPACPATSPFAAIPFLLLSPYSLLFSCLPSLIPNLLTFHSLPSFSSASFFTGLTRGQDRSPATSSSVVSLVPLRCSIQRPIGRAHDPAAPPHRPDSCHSTHPPVSSGLASRLRTCWWRADGHGSPWSRPLPASPAGLELIGLPIGDGRRWHLRRSTDGAVVSQGKGRVMGGGTARQAPAAVEPLRVRRRPEALGAAADLRRRLRPGSRESPAARCCAAPARPACSATTTPSTTPAAVGLVHGRLPYQDFLFLHPPGVLLALAPVAGLGRWVGEATGWEASRLVWMSMGCLTSLVVAGALLRLGKLAAVVGGCFYAIFPGAVLVERTTLTEGLANLCLAVAMALVIGELGRRPLAGDDTRHPVPGPDRGRRAVGVLHDGQDLGRRTPGGRVRVRGRGSRSSGAASL